MELNIHPVLSPQVGTSPLVQANLNLGEDATTVEAALNEAIAWAKNVREKYGLYKVNF